MSKLTAAERRKLPNSTFALPGHRYPIPDRGHAIAAKSDASRAYHEGNMSDADYRKVVSKADRKLHGESERG